MINKFFGYLRLLRGGNLLMMAASILLFQFYIVAPHVKLVGLQPTLNWPRLLLFMFSVCCIAAAAYVINDFFDEESDRIYKKRPQIIGQMVSPDQAYTIYFILNILGIASGFALCFWIDNLKLGYFFVLPALLLWFYSYFIKGWPLIGNLLIAGLTAYMYLLQMLLENNLFMSYYFPPAMEQAAEVVLLFGKGYMLFAFVISLCREFAKDVEDISADRHAGLNTIPVLIGLKWSKLVFTLLVLFLLIPLVYLQWMYWEGEVIFRAVYLLAAVEIPVLISLFIAWRADEESAFGKVSSWLKAGMLGGLGSMLFFYYF
jgi:4-hydroxybenzoate polyprenyltransferase